MRQHVLGRRPRVRGGRRVRLAPLDEAVTGTFGNGTLSLTATRDFNVVSSYSLADAPTDGTTVTKGTTVPVVSYDIDMKVTPPVITNTSTFKNHGDYVKSQGRWSRRGR